jgi:transcriptional regulator with XRE-family HTH domain
MNRMTPLAERLRAIMADRGLKAAPLARGAGLGIDYVRDILSGRSGEPKADKLKKLADYLGLSVDQLLDAHAPPPAPLGFAEPSQAVPWTQPAPHAGSTEPSFAQLLRALCPDAQTPSPMRIAVDLPGFLIGAGDLVVIDLKRPAIQGEIVVVQAIDDDHGSAVTLLRRYAPPYLMPPGGGLAVPPGLADGRANTIMGPVIAVIRAGELQNQRGTYHEAAD